MIVDCIILLFQLIKTYKISVQLLIYLIIGWIFLRNRNLNSIKRKDIQKKNRFVTYNKVIRKLDDLKSSTAHSLIELSEKQWSRFESRSIIISNMAIIPGKVKKIEYNNIQLGKDINLKLKKCI